MWLRLVPKPPKTKSEDGTQDPQLQGADLRFQLCAFGAAKLCSVPISVEPSVLSKPPETYHGATLEPRISFAGS